MIAFLCWRCTAGVVGLRLIRALTDRDYAEDFLWSETPFPAGGCRYVTPLVWREVCRLLLWKASFGRIGRAKASE